METVRPLPAREPLLPGESLASLIRRTASAMGYERHHTLLALLEEAGDLPAHLNHLETGGVLERLGILLRRSPEELKSATVHSYAPKLMLTAKTAPATDACDSKTILRYFQSAHPPICPVCFQEDTAPYERLAWSLRAVPLCFKHRAFLIGSCPQCRRALRRTRLDLAVCPCGFDLRELPTRPCADAAVGLSQQIHAWFQGESLPLPSLPASATLWWLERLAASIRKSPTWCERTREAFMIPTEAPEEFLPWLAAAELLEDWPEKLFLFLDDFQRIDKHRTTATGLSRSFGHLLREAKQLEDLGYTAPADALRQYLRERYTAGHLTKKVCLFAAPEHATKLKQRPWITLTEADQKLRIRRGGSAALLQRGVLAGSIRSARPGHLTVGLVTRESVEALARELMTAVSAAEAGKLLGLSRHRVLELIQADLLPRAVRTWKGWRVPRAGIEALLARIQEFPEASPHANTKDWLKFREATRRFGRTGLNLVRLWKLLQAGQVRARRISGPATFASLLVSATDLKQARVEIQRLRDQDEGFPLNRLSRDLFPGRPLKEAVLRKWIGRGLLQAKKRGRVWVVSPQEVARFRETYCLLKEAAELLQIHPKTLLRWISQGELTPVYGPSRPGGGGFYLLRRGDVIGLSELIRQRSRTWRSQRSAA